jgi:hypothetical protein
MAMRPSRYLAMFFLATAGACLAGSIGWWGASVLTCPPAAPGTFLAYCRNELYGDFEHGAFLYGLESAAVQRAKQAEVVVIGDSRVQFGFSTGAVRRYFADRGRMYYLLGMGYGSTSDYARALLRRHQLRPRVLIVNAEPYFTRDAPAVPAEVIRATLLTRWSYWRKGLFQRAHRPACDVAPALCREAAGGVHRRVDNGEWLWVGLLVPGDLSVPFVEREIASEQAEESGRIAASFVAELGLDPSCVIVTAVPGLTAGRRQVATRIAELMRASAVLPVVDGLSSLDGDHLNAESAERWSAAFLQAADALITECLSTSKPLNIGGLPK